MAVKARSILGIDINPYEIRVVEMQTGGAAVEILAASSAPVPRGALDRDRIAFPDAVSETLHALISRMAVHTRDAVVGIGAESIATRVLDIPRVPDSEVRTVIEGELAHYRLLQEGAGAFDYVRLPEPSRTTATAPQVLLMAVEDRVAAGYREVVERAGLNLLALEPTLLAMVRAAYADVQHQPAAACLSITYGRAEIALFESGQIRLYRQVDVGSDNLVPGRRAMPFSPELGIDAPRRPLGTDEDAGLRDTSADGLSPLAVNDITLELQRSIEYYNRRFAGSEPVSRLVVATHDPEVASLSETLERTLGISVQIAQPPRMPVGVLAGAALPGGSDELRYFAAVGLAAHAQPGMASAVPRFDLSEKERLEAEVVTSRTRLTWSLAASIALLLVGMVSALALGTRANDLADQVEHRRTELQQRQRVVVARIQDFDTMRRQLAMLKMDGYPFPRIMDALAGAVDPQAGLTEVGLDRIGKLDVAGDAASEKAIIGTLEALKRCPYFESTSLDSFESGKPGDREASVVRYKISSQVVGAKPAAEPNPDSANPLLSQPALPQR